MTKEFYLIDHDQNVKGGVLWWLLVILFLLSTAIFAYDMDKQVNSHSEIKATRLVNN